MKQIITIIIALSIYTLQVQAQNSPIGSVEGRLVDAQSKMPLGAANVTLQGTQMGASSDLDGKFTIFNVPVG